MKEHAGFHVEDAQFASRVRESFGRQGLMKHLGAELVELTAGHATIRVPFRAELTQQHNYFHAGVSGAIADSACGYAAYTLMPADSSVLTVEYKLNLLAPADGEELTARARVVRSGRTLKICSADVHAKKNGKEVHCATMLATIMCLPGKPDRAE
ncbi:MAG TPA: PaaI family thioesterase [Candidatus Acidoferrum sp.]|nr:PaaI family thioesterase [Candidatus Acidoferrum sp.]